MKDISMPHRHIVKLADRIMHFQLLLHQNIGRLNVRIPYCLVDEQAVLVQIVLFDELSELVGLLGIVELIQVQDLVSRPAKC